MSGPAAAADRVAATPLEGSGAPFSRATLWVIAGLVLASLATVVALTILAEDMQAEPSNGADGYSASAIGHRGAIKLLRNLDVPVVVSQSNSAAKAKGGLLVIAEPLVTDATSAARFIEMVHAAERVLVVLPKWWTTPASFRKEWASDVELVPEDDVAAVLKELSLDDAKVVRASHPVKPALTIDPLPEMLPEATIEHAAQTLEGGYFEDSLAIDPGGSGAGGTLIGWTTVGDTHVTVLTDPDVMNNHGLDEGKNARFVVGLIDQLRKGGPVVFDEIAHGYTLEPSIWKLMFQWPLVLATLQALICILVIVAATAGRFGPPARTDRPYAAGKDFLIRNTAALLRYGGHDAEALYRYFTVTVQQVRAVLHAPRDLDHAKLTAWLERIRVARRGTIALPELEQWVSAASTDPALARKIPEVAMRIHRWREEMIRGSDKHP